MHAFTPVIAAVISLISATSAFAENPVPAPANPPTLDISNPHNNCAAQRYPAEAVRLGEEGATTLAVSIDETGKPTNAAVIQSSGFQVLDKAAQDCVTSAWHFLPAMQDGKSIASIKQYRIVWKLSAPNFAPQLMTRPEISCASIFADAKNRWPNYRTATLQFRVSSAGVVEFPFAAISSGDALFDAKAVQCMTTIKYSGAILQDIPTDVSWSSAIRWSPHTGIAYTDGERLAPFCPDNLFPVSIWKGDPASPTDISFRIVQGGPIRAASLEQSSGNPALDQAALECVTKWHLPSSRTSDPKADLGEFVRFTWREGHAFILEDPSN